MAGQLPAQTIGDTGPAVGYTVVPAAQALATGASSAAVELTASDDQELDGAVAVAASRGGEAIGSATVTAGHPETRVTIVSRAALAIESEPPAQLQGQGPGIGNLSYTEDELYQPVSWLDRLLFPSRKVWFGTNVGILVNGYFVTLFAANGGSAPGGFDIYDVSDPRNIRRVQRIYEPNGRTGQFRESHGLGVAYIGDAVVVAVQSTQGVEFWDFTDMNDIRQASKLALPGVDGGNYHHVAWQLSWQAPYLYVGVSGQGMYIVDAGDPARPLIADRGHNRPNPVPPAELGGFPVGPVFAMGNHLVVSSMQRFLAWSSLDISDPLNPVLLDTVAPDVESYSTCFDGRRVYSTPGKSDDRVFIYDLSDPGSFAPVDNFLQLFQRLYCATQDHFLFQGGKRDFQKIDMGNDRYFLEIGRGILDVHEPDAGQAWPIGNLVFVGNDHGTGSAFFVHDRNPDRTPPRVIEVSPRDGAGNQAVSTRVGLAFSDGILPESLGPEAVLVLDEGGNRVAGTFSVQLGIVNFAPRKPLQPNTTYTVSVPLGGLTDYVGNAVAERFDSTFTTGAPSPGGPIHRWPLADDAGDWFGRNDGAVVGARFEPAGGLRLDGRGDWVRLENSLSAALSGDATVAFFLATRQAGAATPAHSPGVTGRYDPAAADDVAWGWLDDTGRLRLSVGNGNGIESPQPVNDGQAHHYILTRNAATGELTMYRNGIKIQEGTGDTGAKGGGGGYDRLGAIEGSTASLSGVLEEVQVFNRVLGEDDILLLYGRAETAFSQATLDAAVLVGSVSVFEAADLGDEATMYQWDFGDGTSTAASTSRSASHVYTRPGHYTVVLKVRHGGTLRHYNFVRTVTHPRTSIAPASSSPIHGTASLVYSVNPDNGSLTGIDPNQLGRLWETRVGKHPRTVAADSTGRAWVAVQGDDRLACLEASGRPCGTIDVGHGSAPYGVVFVPGSDTGLVTLEGSGEVLRFDAAAGTVLGRRSVNSEPRGIAISSDGAHAYVTRLRSTAAGLVTKISVPTLARVSDIALRVDDTTVDAEDRARGKPNYLTHVAISPDGRTAWIPSKQDNVLRGAQRDGSALTHDSAVRAIASLVDLAGDRELHTERIDFNDRSGAVAVGFSPRGDYAFVVLQGSNTVAIVDAYSGALRGALKGAGLAPHGIWIDEQTHRAFVTNFTTRTVEVYDISSVLDSTSFESQPIREIDTVAAERLDAQTLRGLQIFYNARDPRMSRDGYISCASCHLGGGEDGTVWDFTARGEGLRNSISLNGREGTRLGNLHWTANFDEVQDFENDIRNAFGGQGFMADADFEASSQPLGTPKAGRSSDLDALASYVTSLDDYGKSPYRTGSGELTASARNGRRLFAELGCQSCHAGPDFTDGQRHDVGTITRRSGQGSSQPLAGVGFKTPPLLGAWRTAPYFHDGSAATLADVIASQHGGERPLEPGERDALSAFLRSLEGPTAEYTRIESLGGLGCWQATGGAVQDLTLSGCASGDSQLWRFDSMGRIHPKSDDGLCVESEGRSASLYLAPCSDAVRQQWRVAGPEVASVGNPDLVVTAHAGDAWTWPRHGASQASWKLVARGQERPELSTVTSLSALTLQGVDFGAFQADVTAYAATVGMLVTEVTVAATPSSARGSVLIGRAGDMAEGASRTIGLAEGENRIVVEVVAEDDQLSRVYAVNVTRSAGLLAGSQLSALSLSGVEIAFDPNTRTYAVTAGSTLASTTVTATPAVEGADVTITDANGSTAGATRTVSLAPGANTITVTVTHAAAGPATTGTYTVTVHREVALAAAFGNAPARHDGRTAFSVGLRFTEEVALGSQAFTAGLLTVSGGTVGPARQLAPPSTVDWEFQVTPSGLADVLILLPANRPCDVQPTVCTPDQRRLLNAASLTVAGPAIPEIAGATEFAVLEGETAVATLVATDADTQAADLRWSIAGGTDAGKFAMAAGGAIAFSAPKDFEDPDDADADGSYQVSVQVSDGVNSGTADLTVTLANRNEAPTANAGADQADIAEGATVTLSGSGIDPDAGDTLAYAWTQAGGPVVVLSDAAAPTPTFTAPISLGTDATLTFTLRVTDQEGLFHEDAMTATVKARPPEATIATGASAVPEGMAATFTVSLNKQAQEALAVAVIVSETGAVLSGSPAATVEFAMGDSSKTLSLTTADDLVVEGDSMVTATVTGGTGYTVGTADSAVVTVSDDDAAAFTVSAEPAAINEGESASLTVAITNGVTFAAEQAIDLAVSGTASAGDYALTPNVLTLAAGAPSVTATLAASRDRQEEADETVTVTASRDGSAIGTATVTIRSVSQDATLSALSLSGIDIGAFSAATTSYEASVPHAMSSTTVTATASHAGATVSISPGTEVSLAEGANTIAVTVTAEDGATTKTYTVTVTRVVLPVATVSASASPVAEGAAATFLVTLDKAAQEALNVAVSVTESGSALSGAPPASVAFNKGETSATLSVPTAGDSVVEADSTVTVSVTAGTGYAVGTPSAAVVTVEDDDAATFTVSADPAAIEEGESATLTVAISNGVTFAEDQAISLATSGTASASDYTGVPPTLTLAAGAASGTATLAAAADQQEEADETVTVTATHAGTSIGSATVTIHSISHDATLGSLSLSGIEIGTFSAAVTSYRASVANSVTATTVTATATHPAASVSIKPGSAVTLAEGENAIAVTVTAEDGTTTKTYTVTVTRAVLPVVSIAAVEERVTGPIGAFTVTRAGPTAEPLEVQVQMRDSRTSRTRVLTFRFPRGQSSLTRRVQAGDNKLVEDDITMTWTLQEGEGYTVSAEQASASLVLEESDTAELAVSAEPAEIAEGESATVTVETTNGVRFGEDQTIALSVSGTASGSDYTGVPATLTLPAYRTSATATLTAAADDEEEDAETVTVTASHGGSAIGSATVTVNSVSHDATLGTLSLSGVDIGTFSAAVTSYRASVANSVTATTVTATATHPAASVSIKPGSAVTLAEGENAIAVTVTAEDGTTRKTYTVTVTRVVLPVVSIAAVKERVRGPIGAVRATRTGPTAEPLEVQVHMTNSRASRVQTLTFRFPRGQSSLTRRVQAGDNKLVEDDITVTWTLQEGEGYTVSAEQASASVVLEESDTPAFAVSAEPAEIAEGESATVTVATTNGVRFREAQTIALSVSGTASGSDYTGVPATLTLPAHRTSTRATLTAVADQAEEADETVTITASHGGAEIGSATVTVTASGAAPAGGGFPLAPENSRPSGIWSDGETAWVADLDDARLYAYQRTDGERQPGKDIATEPAPMGLWSDGKTLWVAGLGGALRAHRLADGSRLARRDLALEANVAPAGVWSDGETAWVADWLGDSVQAYRLSDGKREAVRDIRLAGGNLLPVGLWSDGETLWVADWRERMFSYRVSDGRREPGRDIDAGSADTDPSGLWSDGETLLSTSWEDGTVRAYRLPDLLSPRPALGKSDGAGLPVRAASLPPVADPALQAAILATLGKAPREAVSPEELAGLESLEARNAGIRDLSGLEQAVGLKELDLGFNPLADLRPLAALPTLESLNLDGAATDLRALAPLARLQRLSLRHNGLDNLWALAGLASLSELDIGSNRVEDLSALAGLTGLTVLRADRNRIADLWPLASLARLELLDLGTNRVRDLQPLASLARLKALRLDSNGLRELHALAGLQALRELGLAGNAVEFLHALSNLTRLRRLDLRGSLVDDLRPLRALPALVWVHVGGSGIEDLTPLDGLPGLTVAGRDDREPPIVSGEGESDASRH